MSTPNPSIMQKFAPKRAEQKAEPQPEQTPEERLLRAIFGANEADEPGKIVRPGFTPKLTEGVIKAKQVKPGHVVQAWLHGKPCGGERTVSSVKFDRETGMVTLEFSSPHPTTEYKAAYRFFVKNLVVHEPALVTYEEA